MRSMGLTLAASAAAMFLATSASGQIFLAVKGNQLFRTDGITVEQFTLSDSLHSLSRMSDGRILGISNDPNPLTGQQEVYRLDGALGAAPTLSQINEVAERYPSFSQVRGRVYGFRTVDTLVTMNPANLSETGVVGNMGNPQGIGGSGYDRVNDKLYMTNHATGAFYEVDYSNATINQIGLLGLNFLNQGGEFFGRTYFTALEDVDRDRFILGTVDVATGQFNFMLTLHSGLANLQGTVGLAVVPAPGALALLGLGALFAARRRR